jgi:Caudovirus prohead serine protease
VIGHVPPEGWAATDTGLIASGWIDTEHEVPRHVYRALKSGALQWSIGFARPRSRALPDGGRELLEVDELYELSAVPVPANQRTRTLSVKELEGDSVEELRAEWDRLRRELVVEGYITVPAITNPALEPRNGDRAKAWQMGYELIAGTAVKENTVEARGAPAEHKATGPVQIATFEA